MIARLNTDWTHLSHSCVRPVVPTADAIKQREYRSLLDQARAAIVRELPHLAGVPARRAGRAAVDAILAELQISVDPEAPAEAALPATTIELRRATIDDAERLFTWRNDPVTRANSVQTEEVAWDDHCRWLDASLAAKSGRRLYIAEIDRIPVGTVRIDYHDAGGAELSWTVAPSDRRRGIGKSMVAAAARPGHIVHIKPENIASQKIAAAAGFVLAEDGELQLWVKPG